MYLYRKSIDRNASPIRYFFLLYTACIFDHCEGESISLFECLQMGHGNLVVFQESIKICFHLFVFNFSVFFKIKMDLIFFKNSINIQKYLVSRYICKSILYLDTFLQIVSYLYLDTFLKVYCNALLSTFSVPENMSPGSSIWDQRSEVWDQGCRMTNQWAVFY